MLRLVCRATAGLRSVEVRGSGSASLGTILLDVELYMFPAKFSSKQFCGVDKKSGK